MRQEGDSRVRVILNADGAVRGMAGRVVCDTGRELRGRGSLEVLCSFHLRVRSVRLLVMKEGLVSAHVGLERVPVDTSVP